MLNNLKTELILRLTIIVLALNLLIFAVSGHNSTLIVLYVVLLALELIPIGVILKRGTYV